MKPYTICHMVASVDGRILHSRWRPQTRESGDLFERLHARLGGDPIVVVLTEQMSLESCEVLDGGSVWLRYRLRNEGKPAGSDAS